MLLSTIVNIGYQHINTPEIIDIRLSIVADNR